MLIERIVSIELIKKKQSFCSQEAIFEYIKSRIVYMSC